MNATATQIIEYCKRSLEAVTGARVISIQYQAEYDPERIEKLKAAVCKAYGTTMKDMEKQRRKQVLVRPRQMFYYLAIEKFSMGVVAAGKVFGQDHTTVIHSRDKVRDLLSIMDEETHSKLELISEYLK